MPPQGPIGGGTIVTINGIHFTGAPVTLDRAVVTPLTQTDSEVRLQMPKHDNGYVIISVGAGTAAAYGRFLYLPPRLDEIPAGYITTVAGIGQYSGQYGPATASWFPLTWGLAIDSAGLLYFSDTSNNRIMRIRADAIVEPFAGSGEGKGTHPPGKTPATAVSITFPRSIVFDSGGNLIVPDDSCYLWRVDTSGLAEIIAGTGICATSASDGVAAKGTSIGQPSYVAVDPDDNIYFLEWPAARLRKIDVAGNLSSIAGTGTYGFSGDGGPATNAQFNLLFNDQGGLAIDRAGNIFLVDQGNNRIRRITRATGIIDTIVGPAINGKTLGNLRTVAVGLNGDLYFSHASEIYHRSADGTIAQLNPRPRGFSEDGVLLSEANIGIVYGILIDSVGNILYSDSDVGRLRKIDHTTGRISTLAGSGPHLFGEGGPAVAAASNTNGLAFLPTGELLLVDVGGLFKIDNHGIFTRTAGTGVFGPLFDVPAMNATIGARSVSVSSDGTIDFAGIDAGRIEPDGIVRHTAGSPGVCGFSGDGGDALNSILCQPWDAVRDRDGNLFIADTNNNRIRRVDGQSGIITTFAGSGPPNGLEHYGAGTTCGDGGPATGACINTPFGVTFDDDGNLYIAELLRVRKVDRSGTITTFSNKPNISKLVFRNGSLFSGTARFDAQGATTFLAGGGSGTLLGDGGPALAARVDVGGPAVGVAIDGDGDLFFVDVGHQRIRAVRYGAVLAPANASIQAAAAGSTIRATVFNANGLPAASVRVDFSAPASGASCLLSNPFAVTNAQGVAAVSCVSNCIPGTYTVTARPLTAQSTAGVSFTNSSGPCRLRAVHH